jgi:hypothetical protein
MQYDHVGQKQGERLFSRDIPGAPNRMPKAERLLLPCKARRSGERQMNFEIEKLLLLVSLPQNLFQLELAIEMILDNALVPAGNENEVLDTPAPGLIRDVLDEWPVDNRKHLLGHRLCGGQKSRP